MFKISVVRCLVLSSWCRLVAFGRAGRCVARGCAGRGCLLGRAQSGVLSPSGCVLPPVPSRQFSGGLNSPSIFSLSVRWLLMGLSSAALQRVGVVGSRRPLPGRSRSCLRAVLSLPAVNFATGCCPSGADSLVRRISFSRSLPLSVFRVSGPLSGPFLRARTLQLVASVSCLFVFPVSPVFRHSGSWLAAFSAASRGLPVFLFLPGFSSSALPCCRGVSSWRLIGGSRLAPVLSQFSFFAPVVQQQQIALRGV